MLWKVANRLHDLAPDLCLICACGAATQSPNLQETVQQDAVKAVFPYGQVHLEVGRSEHSSFWTRPLHSRIPNAAQCCRLWKADCAVRVALQSRSWVRLLWPASLAILVGNYILLAQAQA